MLGRGAVFGLAAGLAAQLFVDGGEGSQEWLVRSALLLPTIIFLAWWLLVPGIRLEEPGDEAPTGTVDPDALDRVERIETIFDSAAVPRARRERLEQPSSELRDAYRTSLRRVAAPQSSSTDSIDEWRTRASGHPASSGTDAP